MMSLIARLVRPLVGVCLLVALMVAGATTVSAQSTIDPALDSDGDGTMNNMDFDDDNDGYADDADCAPFDASRWVDCDATGTGDEPDNDGDGIPDRADPDDDNDGIVDDQDSDPFNADIGSSPGDGNIEPDNDGDGIADRVDPDDDNDGVMDEQDSHPFDPTRGEKPPPSPIDPQTDSDGDGIANSHDPDDDNDGVVDELDCAPFDPSISECPDPAPNGDNAGGSTGESVTVENSGNNRGVSGGGPVVTSLPTTGVGGTSSLAPLTAVLGIALALLALAGIRGWLHPVRVPDRRS